MIDVCCGDQIVASKHQSSKPRYTEVDNITRFIAVDIVVIQYIVSNSKSIANDDYMVIDGMQFVSFISLVLVLVECTCTWAKFFSRFWI